jgi:dienelactone hydrolase
LRRLPVVLALAALLAAALGAVLLAGAGHGLRRDHAVVDGVPLDEVHPAGLAPGERRPGVVVAHGFAGSARLMAPFGDSLAARGYVVVLLDFAGHGADTRPLPDDSASTGSSTTELQYDLGVALAHLRALPDVDPARIALVGHSMGATEVTRYAAAHPEVRATVAISLPDSSVAQTPQPARLLLLYGGLEFPGFKAAAADAGRARCPGSSTSPSCTPRRRTGRPSRGWTTASAGR